MTTTVFNNKQIILGGLLAGFFINFCDVLITITTVADAWNKVLLGQGIAFNPMTPPYYIAASFLGGILLCWTISTLSFRYGLSRQTSLKAAFLLWGISRLYGMGHVVMGQMPLSIFATMSAGLLLGYIAGGQVIYWYLDKRRI
jgi:hypothetical protein